MLSFDHPLSERVRNFIRIQHLFQRMNRNMTADDKWLHHVALSTLFEIMDCSSRADLKLELLQELERQRQYIERHSRPDEDELQLLHKIQHASQELQEIQQKFGQHIRENEWLMALKQRISVAGGTTPIDLPGYYHWQKQNAAKRRADLEQWSLAMMPTYHAVNLLLNILRSRRTEIECTAVKGSYQRDTLAQNTHLLSIEVPFINGVIPEVSANKYFTHIRFLEASQQTTRGSLAQRDIPFKMIMCSFTPPDD